MKKGNIYKTTILIIALEIVIKIIGFIKQSIIANYYGAGTEMDIYFVASDFINGFSNMIINSAKIGIVAVYTSVRVKEGEDRGNRLMIELLEILIPVVMIISFLFNLFSLPISRILAPMFKYEQFLKLSEYISFFSWIILFSALCMVFDSVLNSHELYFLLRARAFIYSFVIIAGSVLFSDKYGISVLLSAQYLALILYLVFQIFGIRKLFHFKLYRIENQSELKMILCMLLPSLVGNSMVQINYWVDNAVASSLQEGVVSALSYSHVLDDLFVGVFITTVASVILPHFSNLIANNNAEEIRNTLDNGLNVMTIILIPVSFIAFFCSAQMVEFAFYRGEFKQETVLFTSLALKGYVLRYPFAALRDVSIQALYAYKDTKTPMKNAVICTFVNITGSVLFSRYWGIIAISFATTVSTILGAILNGLALKKTFAQYSFSNIFDIYKKSLVPVIILFSLFYIMGVNINTGLQIVDMMLISCMICSIYYGALILLKQKTVLSIGKKVIARRYKCR